MQCSMASICISAHFRPQPTLLAGPVAAKLNVSWKTREGTAKDGEDFHAAEGVATSHISATDRDTIWF